MKKTAKISPVNRHTVKMSHLSHSNTNSYSSAERRKKIYHIVHSYIHSYSLEKYFTAALILTQMLP